MAHLRTSKSADEVRRIFSPELVYCRRTMQNGRLRDLKKSHRVVSQPQHPWWTTQLDEVTRRSHAYLRRHFPGVIDAHEDIASEVKTQLAEQVSRAGSEYPSSWYGLGPAADAPEHEYFFQLAHTILKRRIADHFRERTVAWARDVDIEELSEESFPDRSQPTQEVRIAHERLLKLCLEFISKLPEEDRLLVARLADSSEERNMPLTASERQRIHRIRKRLKSEFRARLGESVLSALRDD